MHDPATDDDALRRQDHRHGRQGLPEVRSFQTPGLMCRWQRLWYPEVGPDSLPARQALQAILVKWTTAQPCIAGNAGQKHVAHFRMHETMERTAMDDGAAADAGADGEVDQWVASSSSSIH